MKLPGNNELFFKFGFLALILLLLLGCQANSVRKIQSEIDSLILKFVPDQRTGICRVTAKAGPGGTLILSGETTDQGAKQGIIHSLDIRGNKLIDSILILPDTIKTEKFMGLVTLSVINLRKRPEHIAELVDQSILGTPVLILKSTFNWLLIQTPDKYIGWTEKSSVELMTRNEIAGWKNADRVVYMSNSGWLYSSPDESGIVGDLVAGCIMEKKGESSGYNIVMLPDGRSGFVRNSDVISFSAFAGKSITDETGILSRAESLLGIPYLWGGSSSKGVDCSGFVQTVFFMNGIILERDASLQALHGLPVDLSGGFDSLEKGDLLFFGSKENKKLHVTHVAIYIGSGDYINSSGRVMINSLDSTRTDYNGTRKRSLLVAKRVLNVKNDRGIVPVKMHSWY